MAPLYNLSVWEPRFGAFTWGLESGNHGVVRAEKLLVPLPGIDVTKKPVIFP